MSKQAEFAVILKMNPMFADLGADELQRLAGLCHTQQVQPGELLFQKGDANPRDAFGFGGKTMSRHRLIRRGIAYGKYLPPGEEQSPESQDKRGIIFIALNSGFDQFEFVQQKWMNFGDDFEQGNDTDPIAGNRPMIGGRRSAQMMIPGDEASDRRPFICFDIPRFVTTRGGDYFFVPSLAALGLLASGQADVA